MTHNVFSMTHWHWLCVSNLAQAVNKLAEILNRKDMKLDQKKKGSTADLRKKEKENRKLQLDLNQEKEKFNHMAIKYQKELGEMQAVREMITQCCCNLWHELVLMTCRSGTSR